MSPIPVGVIFNSANIAPIKPAETPSRNPAKIIGEAEGNITLIYYLFLILNKKNTFLEVNLKYF